MDTTTSMPNLFTEEVATASAFYRDHLGFCESQRYGSEDTPEHVVLQLGNSMLALSTPRAAAAAGLPSTRGNPLELVIWCADVDAATSRLAAAGVTVLTEPYAHPGGHRRSYVADPDGNWIALVDAH